MYSILFNFSSSYSGGGLKRLEEFSKWFSTNGGASFLINELSKDIIDKYPNNSYYVPKISLLSRLLNKEDYFDSFQLKEKNFDLYYSYGIPITQQIATQNLLHISNVLPFMKGNFGHNLTNRLKFRLLRHYFLKSLSITDILSAESEFSISLFENNFKKPTIVSKNGSDEEIELFLNRKKSIDYANYVVVLGAHKHKNIEDSYQLFQDLYLNNSDLRLKIIGDPSHIPEYILKDAVVEILGVMKRDAIMDLLLNAKFYISTTLLENSYNAASEAIFLAEESYISAIGPHFELLQNLPYEIKKFKNIDANMIQVKSVALDTRNLVRWEQVILDIIKIYNDAKK
jgi:glycosyltransferase involved in cell wall biosynthesis